jgi:hypothetical protein
MASATFTADAGVTPLAFSVNPRYPGRVTVQSGLVRALTEGNEEYMFAKGARYAVIELKFEGMPACDFDGGFDYLTNSQAQGKQSLTNWFLNLASEAFTYTDPFGKSHEVTFADDKLDFQMTDNGLYDGVLKLRELLGR